MSVTSFEYLLFLALAVLLYRNVGRTRRTLCLFVLSCLFYATWDIRGLALLLGSAGISFRMALQIEKSTGPARRTYLAVATIGILTATLLLFKVLPAGLRPVSWLVPLGISYYTFKLLSYVIDVYWEKTTAEKDVLSLFSYAVFFPQILAGPIQRADSYLPQTHVLRPFTLSLLAQGASRIAFGLFKKLVIADQLAPAVNRIYGNPHALQGGPLLAAFYLFPVQLYADFSGLTDIAVGSALLLGFNSPENFLRPFSATSIGEYWRRWHMSLTNWLVDYVFTPLRMATRDLGTASLVLAITVNMVAVGLWHGITLTFLVFGLLHSVFLVIDALSQRQRNLLLKRHPAWRTPAAVAGWLLTLHAVALAMVFFRAQSVADAAWLLKGMWTLTGLDSFITLLGPVPLARALVGYAVFEAIDYARQHSPRTLTFSELPSWARWSVYGGATGCALVGTLLLMSQPPGTVTFIYAIF